MAKPGSTEADSYSDSFEEEEEAVSANSNTSELLMQMQSLATDPQFAAATVVRGKQAANAAQKTAPSSMRGRAAETSVIPKSSALRSSLSNQTFTGSTSADRGKSVAGKPPLLSDSSASRVKPATNHAQATTPSASAVKNFSDSLEVRDAVFSEWLEKKQQRVSLEKGRRLEAKRREEEEKRRKEAEKQERTVKALERWRASKEEQISSKVKRQREEARRRRELEKEKEEKARASELTFKKWREVKTKKLVGDHREKKMLEEEEERKQRETVEKAKSSEQAFKVWRQKKTEILKEEHMKRNQQEENALLRKQEEAMRHKEESDAAFESWKNKKDVTIRQQQTYGKEHTTKVHTKAWCPARSVKYSYPEPGTQAAASRSCSRAPTRTSGTKSARSTISSARSTPTPDSRTITPRGQLSTSNTSQLKTIQVCCQTLEYWCTCNST